MEEEEGLMTDDEKEEKKMKTEQEKLIKLYIGPLLNKYFDSAQLFLGGIENTEFKPEFTNGIYERINAHGYGFRVDSEPTRISVGHFEKGKLHEFGKQYGYTKIKFKEDVDNKPKETFRKFSDADDTSIFNYDAVEGTFVNGELNLNKYFRFIRNATKVWDEQYIFGVQPLSSDGQLLLIKQDKGVAKQMTLQEYKYTFKENQFTPTNFSFIIKDGKRELQGDGKEISEEENEKKISDKLE
jgi:hypothetical protein